MQMYETHMTDYFDHITAWKKYKQMAVDVDAGAALPLMIVHILTHHL